MSNPISYSDEELDLMLDDLESDRIERKESLKGSAPDTVREAVCAFANDLPNHQRPGVVFIGVRDDGTSSHLPVTDELLLQLAGIKTDGNILPPPTMTVSRRRLHGMDAAVITVMPADTPPVRCRGRVYIRIGPRRGIATVQDERILNEKRRYRDVPFDAQPVPSATLSDLNQRVFEEEYVPSLVAPDILAANARTYEQRLASAKMVASADDPTPTVVGLLTLGVRTRDFLPGAYIQFLRIGGTELADQVEDDQVIDGPVAELLRRTEDKLVAHNRVRVEFASRTTEARLQPYPPAALQQIVRNAVMHRTYESTNAPIHVYWFDDRIEIMSPGGPYGAVTADRFGEPGVVDYRNPNLAEALRVLGFVQRFGVGLPVARRELARNGNPPLAFEIGPNHVLFRMGLRA